MVTPFSTTVASPSTRMRWPLAVASPDTVTVPPWMRSSLVSFASQLKRLVSRVLPVLTSKPSEPALSSSIEKLSVSKDASSFFTFTSMSSVSTASDATLSATFFRAFLSRLPSASVTSVFTCRSSGS